MDQKIVEQLQHGVCSNCWSKTIKVSPDYIDCKSCGIHGNPEVMRWCVTVPVYDVITDNGPATIKSLAYSQVYEYHGVKYVLAGSVEGCGRWIAGDYCTSCLSIFPQMVATPTKSSIRKRHHETGDDDKSAASGEKE